MSQIELKPCAHCGSEGLGSGESIPPPRDGMYGIVECYDCDTIVLGENVEDAIRKWNTRSLPSGVVVDREDLQRVLARFDMEGGQDDAIFWRLSNAIEAADRLRSAMGGG